MTRSSPPKAKLREIKISWWVWRQTKACLNFSEALFTLPSFFRSSRLQKASVPYSFAKSPSLHKGSPGSSNASIWRTAVAICGSVSVLTMVSWGCPSSSADSAFRCAPRANTTTFATFKATDQEATFGDEDFVQSVVEGEDVDEEDSSEDSLESTCSDSCGNGVADASSALSLRGRGGGEGDDVILRRPSQCARAQQPPANFDNRAIADCGLGNRRDGQMESE
mmetsp:Transcript_66341/g.215840  ORF Transcript_66341/g.215840 Transcript_66341/m.215840 type:complete len:223 (-) Transcript_66341:3-671(-)